LKEEKEVRKTFSEKDLREENDFAKIDRTSFIPVYYQLVQILEQKIKKGTWKTGDMLPSEAELGEMYGLSRMTVRKALEKLSDAGLIYAQKGRGTFVARPQIDKAIFSWDEFEEDVRSKGMKSSVKLLEAKIVKATNAVARHLDLNIGTPVLFIRRLLLADGEPMVYDRKFLRYFKGKPFLENELSMSAADLVSAQTDIEAISSKISIEATVIREDEAEILKIPAGSPAFYVEQTLYAAGEIPMSWGWYIYRGDKYKFTSLVKPF